MEHKGCCRGDHRAGFVRRSKTDAGNINAAYDGTGHRHHLAALPEFVNRRAILALTQTRWRLAVSRRADEPRLQQVELCPAVHLPLHQLELGDLSLGLELWRKLGDGPIRRRLLLTLR
jgi:hypothetical protein